MKRGVRPKTRGGKDGYKAPGLRILADFGAWRNEAIGKSVNGACRTELDHLPPPTACGSLVIPSCPDHGSGCYYFSRILFLPDLSIPIYQHERNPKILKYRYLAITAGA